MTDNPDARAVEEAKIAAAIADRVVSVVVNMDDRTSPADWPEALLVTADELHAIVAEAADTALRTALTPTPAARGEETT